MCILEGGRKNCLILQKDKLNILTLHQIRRVCTYFREKVGLGPTKLASAVCASLYHSCFLNTQSSTQLPLLGYQFTNMCKPACSIVELSVNMLLITAL